MLSWGISWRGRGLCDPQGVRLCIWVDKVLLQPAATKAKALPVSGWGKHEKAASGWEPMTGTGCVYAHRGMEIYAYMHVQDISYHITERRRQNAGMALRNRPAEILGGLL